MRASRALRVAAVVLLTAVAVAGVRAREAVTLDTGAHRLDGGRALQVLQTAGSVVVGVAVLTTLVVLAVSRRRRPRDEEEPAEQAGEDPPAGVWVKIGALVMVLLLVGAAVGALVLVVRYGSGTAARAPAGEHGADPPAGGGHAADSSTGLVLPAAGILLLAVAVGAVVLRWRRGTPSPPPEPAAQPDTGPEPSAWVPLDARDAVIADYAAMEAELARARLVRTPAETPGELLARAGRQGLPTSEARQLAELYASARFSTHPVRDGDRARSGRLLAAARRRWRSGS